jgi:Flp pilus assembly protein TadD
MSKPIANVASEQDSRLRLERAKQLLTNRQFQAAEQLLCRAVAKNPSDAEVFNLLGLCAELKGHLQGASRFFRAALSFEPAYTPAQLNLKRVTSWPYSVKGLSDGLKPGHPTD